MSSALHLLPVAAAALFTGNVWDATLQALANLAAIVTIASGVVAWIALQDGESTASVADAAGLGVALGFVPGIVVAVYVYFHVAQVGLH